METNSKLAAGKLTFDAINEIVEKMGGADVALSFLRGELVLAPSMQKWTEEKGVYFLTVISDNLSSKKSLRSLEVKGFVLNDEARMILSSSEYVPTNKIAYKIAIFRGAYLRDGFRNLLYIHNKAKLEEYDKPSLEIVRLLRESLSNEDLIAMKLWAICVCHKPAQIGDNEYAMCAIKRDGANGLILAEEIETSAEWSDDTGFAFVVSAIPVEG